MLRQYAWRLDRHGGHGRLAMTVLGSPPEAINRILYHSREGGHPVVAMIGIRESAESRSVYWVPAGAGRRRGLASLSIPQSSPDNLVVDQPQRIAANCGTAGARRKR